MLGENKKFIRYDVPIGSDNIDPACPCWPAVVRTTVWVVPNEAGIPDETACNWFIWDAFETGTDTSKPVVGFAVASAAPAAPVNDNEIEWFKPGICTYQ